MTSCLTNHTQLLIATDSFQVQSFQIHIPSVVIHMGPCEFEVRFGHPQLVLQPNQMSNFIGWIVFLDVGLVLLD